MVTEKMFNSIEEIQRLQELACNTDEEVTLHSLDDEIVVDAKSFIGLFSLDFNQPVKVVCDSEEFHKKLEKI